MAVSARYNSSHNCCTWWLNSPLPHQKLIDTICRDTLNVNINAPPRKTDLSRLTNEELQMAAVINPNTERDVCRPPTRWQRFASMFGIGG